MLMLFFFNDTATTEIYTLSLHDALPICGISCSRVTGATSRSLPRCRRAPRPRKPGIRSEEHTSELQSQSNLVCRLLLEKKKTSTRHHPHTRLPRHEARLPGLPPVSHTSF